MNLRSQVSRLFGAFKASEADSSSQLPLQSQDGVNPSTPQNKQRGAKSTDMLPSDAFMAVPDEVLVQIVTKLNSTSDLCSLASVAKRWQSLVEGCEDHWRSLFQQTFCPGMHATVAQHRAAELATSWKKLFQSRFMAQVGVAPWEKPSHFEIQAAIEQMYIRNPTTKHHTPTQELHQPNQNQNLNLTTIEETCIIFLIDGSGSVTEEDFTQMTSFILTAAQVIRDTKQPHQQIHIGIVQFSNDVKVELMPTRINGSGEVALKILDGGGDGEGEGGEEGGEEEEEEELSGLLSAVENMVRLNGGTNIAAAITKAGQLFKALTNSSSDGGDDGSSAPVPRASRDCKKVIALLTDGRIESFQAREAKEITAWLVDEQGGNVELHAFGCGRGVDRMELLRIVGGACRVGEEPGDRYLPLMVMEDAPW